MQNKSLLLAAALLACGAVHAQSTPAKKELAARIVKLQQPGIEAMAGNLAQQPAAQLLEQAEAALPSRVPADKREAVVRDIRADAKKYLDEAIPLVRERAVKLAPSTVGALLEEKFSEDELKQLIAIIESPVNRKFAQLNGEMQKVLVEKLVSEMQSTIDPKVKALEQSITKRLGLPAAPVAPVAKVAKPPVKAASK